MGNPDNATESLSPQKTSDLLEVLLCFERPVVARQVDQANVVTQLPSETAFVSKVVM